MTEFMQDVQMIVYWMAAGFVALVLVVLIVWLVIIGIVIINTVSDTLRRNI